MGIPLFLVGVSLSVGYLLLRSVYRLFFHPLSKFPGPKIAAITHAYEFYYDAIKGGMYMWEVQKMHEKYGPIVRISPREIHIKDAHFYDQIYTSGGKKQEKDPYTVRVFTSPLSAAATVDHHHHRLRRETLNPFFSKRAVVALEHIIHDKVAKVRDALIRAHKDKTVVSLDGIFAALTADVISHYTYGESMGVLDSKDLKNEFREAVSGAAAMCHISRFVPGLPIVLDAIPGFIQWMQPSTKGLFDAKRMIEESATLALKGELKKGDGSKTIFDSLTDPSLPAEERTPRRLRDEALTVLGAGTETTGRVLTVGSFYLYRDPAMLKKLRDELRRVMPEPTTQVPLPELEKLPYLTAVINESLRLAHSVTLRLPRISPDSVLKYGDWEIPAGTAVSQSIYFVHTDPTIFPNPDKFDPERWIEAADRGERLTKYLVPFTKGPRICLGLNLAYSEMYQMFAALVRGFDLEIYKTTEESIRITRDMMIGLPDSEALEVDSLVASVITH